MFMNFHSNNLAIVRLGDHNLKSANSRHVDHEIKKPVLEHEDYDRGMKTNDIALIKLVQDVTFTEFIRPACLHQGGVFTQRVVAVSLMVKMMENFCKTLKISSDKTGWGKTGEHNMHSDILLKVNLETISNEACTEKLGNEIEANEIISTQICARGRAGQVGDVKVENIFDLSSNSRILVEATGEHSVSIRAYQIFLFAVVDQFRLGIRTRTAFTHSLVSLRTAALDVEVPCLAYTRESQHICHGLRA